MEFIPWRGEGLPLLRATPGKGCFPPLSSPYYQALTSILKQGPFPPRHMQIMGLSAQKMLIE